MAQHCLDNAADRKTGEYWEREFCKMAGAWDKSFTAMQIGRDASAQAVCKNGNKWNSHTLPDITIWTAPGEHHEIKHKNPTRNEMFGLEIYRFNALLWFAKETKQSVLYTIHNHDLAGGRDVKQNDIAHWVTVNVMKLNNAWSQETWTFSWVGGIKKRVPIYYWKTDLWEPLTGFWENQ